MATYLLRLTNFQLAENPESSLAGPQPQFRSRYADPNHPANSGSLISLITGGHINPPKGRRRQDIRIARAHLRGEVITPQTGKRKEGLVKRILKKVSHIPNHMLCRC